MLSFTFSILDTFCIQDFALHEQITKKSEVYHFWTGDVAHVERQRDRGKDRETVKQTNGKNHYNIPIILLNTKLYANNLIVFYFFVFFD